MSRKYNHQGYQDSSRDDDRPRSQEGQRGGDRPKGKPQGTDRLTNVERIQQRSLRRATTREANEVVRCHECGRSVQTLETINHDSTCPSCSAGLHCCRTCKHFNSGARWQCNAEIAAAVSDKGKANRCSHYVPRLVLDSTGRRTSTERVDDPKSAFENLFKR